MRSRHAGCVQRAFSAMRANCARISVHPHSNHQRSIHEGSVSDVLADLSAPSEPRLCPHPGVVRRNRRLCQSPHQHRRLAAQSDRRFPRLRRNSRPFWIPPWLNLRPTPANPPAKLRLPSPVLSSQAPAGPKGPPGPCRCNKSAYRPPGPPGASSGRFPGTNGRQT